MRIAKRWMAIGLTFVPVLVVALTMAGNAAAGNAKLLILDPSVGGGAASLEAVAAGDAGEGVDVVDAATWSAMTTEDFAAYDAIVIGDGRCDADQSAAVANAATWSAAVTGNVIAIGLDPGYHADLRVQRRRGKRSHRGRDPLRDRRVPPDGRVPQHRLSVQCRSAQRAVVGGLRLQRRQRVTRCTSSHRLRLERPRGSPTSSCPTGYRITPHSPRIRRSSRRSRSAARRARTVR